MKKLLMVLVVVMLVAAGVYAFKLQRSVEPSMTQSEPMIAQTGIPQLTTNVLIDGLSNAWDVGFLPDKTPIITERAGEISLIKNGQKQVISKVDNLYVTGEGGLLGMVVDPDFKTNRFIYACYDTRSDIRVSRWKMDIGQSRLEEQTDIVTGMPVNTSTFPGRHSGCRPRFGADGNLWIGTGDVGIGSYPQDPKSLGGKVLRVDRNGKAVAGNMTAPFDERIYNYGHRNIQGLAMLAAPVNGSYGYSVEHGSDRDDEVNQLVPGNFGWDPIPGYNENVSMTDTAKYPEAVLPVWKSGKPTIAPSGATIITGANWGDWNGAIAMAVQKGQHVRILQLDTSGKLLDEMKILTNFGRIRSVVMGPDNTMYFTTDNGKAGDKLVQVTTK